MQQKIVYVGRTKLHAGWNTFLQKRYVGDFLIALFFPNCTFKLNNELDNSLGFGSKEYIVNCGWNYKDN